MRPPGIDLYRGFGLLLSVAGGLSAVYSYFFFGLGPLTAFMIGLVIVGLSIVLTPTTYPRRSREIVDMMNRLLINISYLLETLRISSHNLFKSDGENVFIYLSRSPFTVEEISGSNNFLIRKGNEIILRLISPITMSLIRDFREPCSAINYLIVDHLDIGDRVECVEELSNIYIKILYPSIPSPHRVERVLGGLYGVVAGSVISLLRGDASIEVSEATDEYIRIVARRIS